MNNPMTDDELLAATRDLWKRCCAARNPTAILSDWIERHRAEVATVTRERNEARQENQYLRDEKAALDVALKQAIDDERIAVAMQQNAEHLRDAAESALAAVSDDGADRVISDLLIASAPYADMDETGRLPKAREQAERLLNEPDLSAKQRYANHYEEQIGFLVERFAEALSSKLRKAEGKYQYQGAWRRDSWHDALVQQIRRHMDKGDPLDVAAYCAFAWHHGWTLAAPHTSAESALAAAQKRVTVLEKTLRDMRTKAIAAGRSPKKLRWLREDVRDLCSAALAGKEPGNGNETVRPDQQVGQ